jgi:DNA-binding NarL/FixJ family response regulator
LVVDDEQHICDLMSIWLDDDPRCERVWTASELDAAVRIARDHRPDAILLDFQVAGRTSVEVLPDLRSTCPHAHIIVHTSDGDAARRADVEGRGADRVVEKLAVSVPDLVEAVLGNG